MTDYDLTRQEVATAIKVLETAAGHEDTDDMAAALFGDATSNLIGQSPLLCGELVTSD